MCERILLCIRIIRLDSLSSSSHSHSHAAPRSISVSSHHSDDLADYLPRRHLRSSQPSHMCTCAIHEWSHAQRQMVMYACVIVQIMTACVLLGVAINGNVRMSHVVRCACACAHVCINRRIMLLHAIPRRSALSTVFVSPLLYYTILGAGLYSFCTSIIRTCTYSLICDDMSCYVHGDVMHPTRSMRVMHASISPSPPRHLPPSSPLLHALPHIYSTHMYHPPHRRCDCIGSQRVGCGDECEDGVGEGEWMMS